MTLEGLLSGVTSAARKTAEAIADISISIEVWYQLRGLRSVIKAAVPLAPLAVVPIYGSAVAGCGEEEQPCDTSADCGLERYCSAEGVCVGSGYENGEPNPDKQFIEDYCDKYWNECNLSGETNFHLGNSYQDCVGRGQEYLDSLRNITADDLSESIPEELRDEYAEQIREASISSLHCLAYEKTCSELRGHDPCGFAEGDLYSCTIDRTGGC
ncbi:MAG TPA: hypothetical protein VJI15_04375 [Candidatus Nanoarchaeia archaeon]|nr:hypothetical protein [Candidatus Nanoarchaeia archaeon]